MVSANVFFFFVLSQFTLLYTVVMTLRTSCSNCYINILVNFQYGVFYWDLGAALLRLNPTKLIALYNKFSANNFREINTKTLMNIPLSDSIRYRSIFVLKLFTDFVQVEWATVSFPQSFYLIFGLLSCVLCAMFTPLIWFVCRPFFPSVKSSDRNSLYSLRTDQRHSCLFI